MSATQARPLRALRTVGAFRTVWPLGTIRPLGTVRPLRAFGPLDAQTRQIMGNLLLDLWSGDRKAVLFVTHDLEEAIALSDRVVIMSAGPASRVIGDWQVALPRPRDIAEIKLEPAFHDMHREIWASLKAEVLRQMAEDR